ncbi:MAG: hypothetical protein WBB23_06870 [Desulforhopalus sp.]
MEKIKESKPTNGRRLCAACNGIAQKDDGLCLRCNKKFTGKAVCFEVVESMPGQNHKRIR